MKQYTIDFSSVKTYDDFYDAISEGLEFPSWFGRNLDAVWDLLTGHIEYPADIHIKGASELSKDLNEIFLEFSNIINRTQEVHESLVYNVFIE